MKSILIDTHIWIWYANGDKKLSHEEKKIISQGFLDSKVHIAAISLWELAMLEKKQRITLDMPCLEWIRSFFQVTHCQLVPMTPEIAVESCCLPGDFHDDPADRMIAATARVEHLSLMTHDARMIQYGKNHYLSVI